MPAPRCCEGVSWYRWDGGDLVLSARIKPNARHAGVDGLHGGAVRIAVQAPPREDKANDALLDYLAEAFGVPRRRVILEHGAHARGKRLRITAPRRMPPWFSELGGAPADG